MTTQDYYKAKREFLDKQLPFRAVKRDEIASMGDNIFRISGMELEVEPYVSTAIDKFIGLQAKQGKGIKKSFGDEGLSNFRNLMLQSDIEGSANKIALIANPAERKIVECAVIKGSPIPATSFFDFIEMFMDRTGYYPNTLQTSTIGQGYAEITLKPFKEHLSVLGKDDEFLDNGLWFRWNLGGISTGNYFERMICSNGAVELMHNKLAQVASLEEEDMHKIMAIPADRLLMNSNWEKFSASASIATDTMASMDEMRRFKRILLHNDIEEGECESVIPLNKYIDFYNAAGYDTKRFPMAYAKTDMTVWTLFNLLTYFASHTLSLSYMDSRRTYIMEEGVNLLCAKRDIQEYVNIF